MQDQVGGVARLQNAGSPPILCRGSGITRLQDCTAHRCCDTPGIATVFIAAIPERRRLLKLCTWVQFLRKHCETFRTLTAGITTIARMLYLRRLAVPHYPPLLTDSVDWDGRERGLSSS